MSIFKWKCFCIGEPELSINLDYVGDSTFKFSEPETVRCPVCCEIWKITKTEHSVQGKPKTVLHVSLDSSASKKGIPADPHFWCNNKL